MTTELRDMHLAKARAKANQARKQLVRSAELLQAALYIEESPTILREHKKIASAIAEIDRSIGYGAIRAAARKKLG